MVGWSPAGRASGPVRSAGSVLDEAVPVSITYGVLELAIPLVVVLGYQLCGGVTAAVHAAEAGESLAGHMRYMFDQIRPVIDRGLRGAARVDATIAANGRPVRSRVAAEPTLAGRVTSGELALIGVRYERHSRTVHQTHRPTARLGNGTGTLGR
ncbi:carbonic anhydrase [Streptomyces sp. NPDC057939]|uniref:carbonic anhydrase n=1 Tax=Streptomyces sp. NPDC057939 TaxID=3346284 RepID=UPI0036EEEF58